MGSGMSGSEEQLMLHFLETVRHKLVWMRSERTMNTLVKIC